MQQQNRSNSEESVRKFMSSVMIKVPSYTYTKSDRIIIKIQTYSLINEFHSLHNSTIQHKYNKQSQKHQLLTSLYRSLPQLQALVQYILRQYGGHIIPTISRKMLKQQTDGQTLIKGIQSYLQQLKQCWYIATDRNLYCFLFQQAMLMKPQQLYSKVLMNASIISKKYLNSIFTRKQVPQHSSSQNLQKMYQKLTKMFNEQYYSLKQLFFSYLAEAQAVQQIFICLSELSTVSTCSLAPQGHLLIQTQKILNVCSKYQQQAHMAYERWQILIQEVRQSQNNIMKGLREQQAKYEQRVLKLNKYTITLSNDFTSMIECVHKMIQKLSNNLIAIKNLEYEVDE